MGADIDNKQIINKVKTNLPWVSTAVSKQRRGEIPIIYQLTASIHGPRIKENSLSKRDIFLNSKGLSTGTETET